MDHTPIRWREIVITIAIIGLMISIAIGVTAYIVVDMTPVGPVLGQAACRVLWNPDIYDVERVIGYRSPNSDIVVVAHPRGLLSRFVTVTIPIKHGDLSIWYDKRNELVLLPDGKWKLFTTYIIRFRNIYGAKVLKDV